MESSSDGMDPTRSSDKGRPKLETVQDNGAGGPDCSMLDNYGHMTGFFNLDDAEMKGHPVPIAGFTVPKGSASFIKDGIVPKPPDTQMPQNRTNFRRRIRNRIICFRKEDIAEDVEKNSFQLSTSTESLDGIKPWTPILPSTSKVSCSITADMFEQEEIAPPRDGSGDYLDDDRCMDSNTDIQILPAEMDEHEEDYHDHAISDDHNGSICTPLTPAGQDDTARTCYSDSVLVQQEITPPSSSSDTILVVPCHLDNKWVMFQSNTLGQTLYGSLCLEQDVLSSTEGSEDFSRSTDFSLSPQLAQSDAAAGQSTLPVVGISIADQQTVPLRDLSSNCAPLEEKAPSQLIEEMDATIQMSQTSEKNSFNLFQELSTQPKTPEISVSDINIKEFLENVQSHENTFEKRTTHFKDIGISSVQAMYILEEDKVSDFPPSRMNRATGVFKEDWRLNDDNDDLSKAFIEIAKKCRSFKTRRTRLASDLQNGLKMSFIPVYSDTAHNWKQRRTSHIPIPAQIFGKSRWFRGQTASCRVYQLPTNTKQKIIQLHTSLRSSKIPILQKIWIRRPLRYKAPGCGSLTFILPCRIPVRKGSTVKAKVGYIDMTELKIKRGDKLLQRKHLDTVSRSKTSARELEIETEQFQGDPDNHNIHTEHRELPWKERNDRLDYQNVTPSVTRQVSCPDFTASKSRQASSPDISKNKTSPLVRSVQSQYSVVKEKTTRKWKTSGDSHQPEDTYPWTDEIGKPNVRQSENAILLKLPVIRKNVSWDANESQQKPPTSESKGSTSVDAIEYKTVRANPPGQITFQMNNSSLLNVHSTSKNDFLEMNNHKDPSEQAKEKRVITIPKIIRTTSPFCIRSNRLISASSKAILPNLPQMKSPSHLRTNARLPNENLPKLPNIKKPQTRRNLM